MRYRFGHHELDTDAFELRVDGEVVLVEPQVFDVLAHLVTHRDRVVPKEELLDEIWGDRFVSESALSSRVMSARKAVGDDGRQQSVIKTVHGRGFRFVAPIEERDDDESGRHAAEAPSTQPHSLRAAPRTRYAHGAGGAIAYQVVGDGPIDLVFVPGFVSNVELQWEFPPMAAFFSRLASFARLITFDKRGTGLSERLTGGATLPLEERMSDVRTVMDAAGSERATLVGISEGGPMSLLLAATHPERVERLVLINAFAGSNPACPPRHPRRRRPPRVRQAGTDTRRDRGVRHGHGAGDDLAPHAGDVARRELGRWRWRREPAAARPYGGAGGGRRRGRIRRVSRRRRGAGGEVRRARPCHPGSTSPDGVDVRQASTACVRRAHRRGGAPR